MNLSGYVACGYGTLTRTPIPLRLGLSWATDLNWKSKYKMPHIFVLTDSSRNRNFEWGINGFFIVFFIQWNHFCLQIVLSKKTQKDKIIDRVNSKVVFFQEKWHGNCSNQTGTKLWTLNCFFSSLVVGRRPSCVFFHSEAAFTRITT